MSGKRLGDIERNLVFHNVVTSPAQLVRHRFDRHNPIGGLSRTDIADVCIGKMLSCAPVGKDGVWPCEPVRDTMEEIQSESMMKGAHTGIYNSRGFHWRGEGGEPERELADKYRKWSKALQVTHPFVASKLLMGLAKTYEHDASREDTEAGIRRRLR